MEYPKQHETPIGIAGDHSPARAEREYAGLSRKDRRALAAIDRATAKIDRKIAALENRGGGND